VTEPSLPLEPLRTLVDRRIAALGITRRGSVGALGSVTGTTCLNRWAVACRKGKLTVWAADELAISLGLHPAQVWGDDWFSAAG
jgi:hypothetical protein